MSTKYSRKKLEWARADDVSRRLEWVVGRVGLGLDVAMIKCFRSVGANTRAVARIWGLPRIWQLALDERPQYVLEVISEKYDKLSEREQDKVLLHELAHVPKTFSGALLPHRRRGKGNFYTKLRKMVGKYERNR